MGRIWCASLFQEKGKLKVKCAAKIPASAKLSEFLINTLRIAIFLSSTFVDKIERKLL